MRLLIVEDEKRLALSLARGLTAEGYAVDVVHDGREGPDRATTEPYDLVILDIMLPGLNGYRVCAALRAALTGSACRSPGADRGTPRAWTGRRKEDDVRAVPAAPAGAPRWA